MNEPLPAVKRRILRIELVMISLVIVEWRSPSMILPTTGGIAVEQ